MLCLNISTGQIIADLGLSPVDDKKYLCDFGTDGILRVFVTCGSVSNKIILDFKSFIIEAVLVIFF